MFPITRTPILAPSSLVGLRNRIVFAAESLGVCAIETTRLACFASQAARIVLEKAGRGDATILLDRNALAVRFSPWPQSCTRVMQSFSHIRTDGDEALLLFQALNGENAYGPADAARISEAMQRSVLPSRAELEMMATHDGLTGVLNRKAFEERLTAEVARAGRYELPLSLAMLDIDFFKKVNDTYGHQAGDACLVHVAGLARTETRESDIVARYGGEEFVIVMPHTRIEDARLLAERLRRRVEASRIESGGNTIACTVSIGIAGSDGSQPIDAKALLGQADAALYRAKDSGRNRVCIAGKQMEAA